MKIMHRSIASFVVLLSSTASFASATTSAMADLGVQMLEVPVHDNVEERGTTNNHAARLMKNKEDIDVQSNYHEEEIGETGNVPDDHAARLVRNRGPITAKVTATGMRRVAGHRDGSDGGGGGGGGGGGSVSDDYVRFSLVAWKFAGDDGLVRGIMEDDGGLIVDVDCMWRDGNVAIVGGATRDGRGGNSRAYVRVIDGGNYDDLVRGGDYISNVYVDDGVSSAKSGCRAKIVEENLSGGGDRDATVDVGVDDDVVVGSIVSVCSKHGDWEGCLRKRTRIEEAIARVDRAIE